MSDWQPIDTAPKGGIPVILCCKGRGPLSPRQFEFARWGVGGLWYRQNGSSISCAPTHWMPLPPPPKAQVQP